MKFIFLALMFWLCSSYTNFVLADEPCPDNNVAVFQIQKTRFGDANLVGFDCLPPSAIMFNGKKVFENSGMYVGFEGYFQQGNIDVLLLSTNSGGSGKPDVTLSFLLISPDQSTRIVSNPEFISKFGDIRTHQDNQGRIFVNLGFYEGHEIVAELDGAYLTIRTISKQGGSMNLNSCKELYDLGEQVCGGTLEEQTSDCRDYVTKFEQVAILWPLAAAGAFHRLSNMPGFKKAGYRKACVSWCTGKPVLYDEFKKLTCSIN